MIKKLFHRSQVVDNFIVVNTKPSRFYTALINGRIAETEEIIRDHEANLLRLKVFIPKGMEDLEVIPLVLHNVKLEEPVVTEPVKKTVKKTKKKS